MRGIPIAVLFAAAAVTIAAPANADPLDNMTDTQKGQRLVQVLRTSGVPVTDPAKIELMAQTMCFSLRRGQSVSSVVADVSSMTGWTSRQASMFYGGAAAGFCPEFSPR